MSILDIEEIGHVEINVVLKAAQRHEIFMVFMEALWSLREATTACLECGSSAVFLKIVICL